MSASTRLTGLALVWLLAVELHGADLDGPMREIERLRGLEFTGPVASSTIERAELPQRLRDQLTRGLPYSVEEWSGMLEALLLVEPTPGSPFDQLIDLYQEQVLAYYDPQTRTFYALREPPAALEKLAGIPAQDAVVVHELVHALQDQHFDIGARERALRKNTDASLAYHAVLEGEASLVMLAYMLEKSGADFDTLVREPLFDSLLTSTAAADLMFDSSAPPYFVELMKFPYLQGLRFVLEAYRRGGWAELDRVHADPPRSTREVLHPADYFERRFRAAPFVAEPPLQIRATAVERLGAFHWAFLLGAEHARTWTADRVTVAYDAACEPTVLVEASWASDSAALNFHRSYVRLLDKRGIGFVSDVRGREVRIAYGADVPLMSRFVKPTQSKPREAAFAR